MMYWAKVQKTGGIVMGADLNYNSSVPLYAQIVELIQRDIETGVFNQTGRLPTEGELAEQYQVSRITIRRAVDELVVQYSNFHI